MTDPTNPPTDLRPCGDCFACCVWLGFNDPPINKHSGQSCKMLDGRDPERRCTIYKSRPETCVKYVCAWKVGIGADDQRPNQSGLLVTFYNTAQVDQNISNPNTKRGAHSATVVVTNADLAGTLDDPDSHLSRMCSAIMYQSFLRPDLIGDMEIRIVHYPTKECLRIYEGKIWKGQILPARSNADLNFVCFEPPIGTFQVDTSKLN